MEVIPGALVTGPVRGWGGAGLERLEGWVGGDATS